MDALFLTRPMLNSSIREGTADAELLVKRAIARLDGAHETNYMVEGLIISWEERSRLLKDARWR